METVGAYMSTRVLTTRPDALAHDAAHEMFENNVGALLVKQNGKYVGIFTKMDWIHKALKWEGDPSAVQVASIMTAPLITIEKDEPLAKASLLMEKNRVRHLAVAEDGETVGILSVKDLERYYRKLYGVGL